MPSIESTFDAAVAAKVIPGAVLAASSTDANLPQNIGSYSYANSFGVRSLKDGDASQPLELDAVLWMGSCTKLMTAIAALQCVERGQFTLDEDATRLLPELKDIEVQNSSKDGTGPPIRVKAVNKITLRHLLTHTSGLSYTKFGDLSLPLIDRCLAPLVFEPGKGFMYGTGTDFAGLMVERVSGISLEHYIQQHIAARLGIESVCFRPRSYPDIYRRLVDVSIRKEKSGPVQWTPDAIWPLDMAEDSGGSGAYATIVEYQRILHSITTDDGVLLQSSMVDELFRPDMSPAVRDGVKRVLKDENTNNIFGGLPKGTDVSYAMGGMVVLEDLPGRRSKGTLHWGALLNIFFWMDRTNGLSGIYASQVFPAGDPNCLALFAEFERKTYEAYRALSDRA
ncbi:beta-lactamase/transpeptidase-like protein [Xylariales sp. AK1849]|nr:beta-lactamase/transpeptidase-like protein [Xylariales sp. AK1849]